MKRPAMHAMRPLAWSLSLFALLALTFAIFQARQAKRLDAAVAAARLRHENLQAQLRRASAPVAPTEAREPAPHRSEAAASPGAAPREDAVAATRTAPRSSNLKNPLIVTARNPELRALYLKSFEEEIAAKWGPLFALLHLSPEKIERFTAIILAHEQNRLDVTAVAGDQNLSLGDPAIQRMRSEDGAQLARQMRTLFEPGTEIKLYNRYHHDLELQPIVADVAREIYATASPLSLEQAHRLMLILSDASQKRANDFVRPGTVDWDAVLARVSAEPAFSPAMVDAMRRRVAQQKAEKEMGKTWGDITRRMVGPNATEDFDVGLPSGDILGRTW